MESLDKWDDYTAAKEEMFATTDTDAAPWIVVKSNDKKRARINAMRYVLAQFDYDDKDSDVVGEPDPVYGEQVVAFVAVRSGQTVDEEALRQFARQILADYKVPERIVFLGELRDASNAPDLEQAGLALVRSGMRGIGLDHADQAVPGAQRVIDHGEIARLENVERHLPARQQQSARQREYRDYVS